MGADFRSSYDITCSLLICDQKPFDTPLFALGMGRGGRRVYRSSFLYLFLSEIKESSAELVTHFVISFTSLISIKKENFIKVL